jgi:hypothetical protein
VKLSDYQESKELQQSGAPIAIGDSVFYVRRLGTKESQEALKNIRQQLYGPFHKMADTDNNRLYGHWLTEYGVTGWTGVDDQDGALEYSKEAARNIFTNPDYFLSLNDLLISAALRFENYLHDEAQADGDKLEKK